MAADAPPVESVPSRCGCAGKTSLRRVVYPARERLRRRLPSNVALAGTLDAALLPNTDSVERATDHAGLDAAPASPPAGPRHGTWSLAATFADAALGADADAFADALGAAYAGLERESRVVVGKAHTVQVADATASDLWFEHLVPRGDRRPGYRAANVDVVHAFPDLAPGPHAAVAARHALGDCYAAGATADREIRPLVAVPRDAPVTPAAVRAWYRDALPAVVVHPAGVLRHDGTGWLFGATATATTTRRPPVRLDAVEPGFEVLLHRPLGGLALYAHAVDAGDDEARRRALAALTADHRPAADALASFLPDAGESFDPSRHIAVVTDVTGPGLRGLSRLAARAGGRLHVTDLPLLDRSSLAAARRRWVVPDVTVETNGPLAVVARPAVCRAVADALAAAGASPVELGEIRASESSSLTAAADVALGEFVEWVAGRRRGSSNPRGERA